MKTIGKGIVLFENENAVSLENLNLPAGASPTPFTYVPVGALAAILAAALWVASATRLGLPVSTSHSIVGGVLGSGLALVFFSPPALSGPGVQLSYAKLAQIVLSWILTVPSAIFFAFLIYHVSSVFLHRVRDVVELNKLYGILTILTACFVAYSFGANDVGNAVGAVGAANPGFDMGLLKIFGGAAIACGAIMFSHRVIETLGKHITVLAPPTAFAAQAGTAVTVYILTMFGMPVSTSHSAVGGVIGAGLVGGVSTVRGKKIGIISLAWVLTPLVPIAIAFGLTWLLMGA